VVAIHNVAVDGDFVPDKDTRDILLKQASHLKEQAKKSRRLAIGLSVEADRRRLLDYADELEATAAGIERDAEAKA
jgi:hypothetical protein